MELPHFRPPLKIWWCLFIVGSGAAIMPLFLDGSEPVSVRIVKGFTAVIVFAVPLAIAHIVSSREKNHDAEHARSQVLRPARSLPNSKTVSAATLLHPEHCRSPFYERKREIGILNRWLEDAEERIIIISGSALTGKSRLAIEWAIRSTSNYVFGWLQPGAGAEAIGKISACEENAVLMIDASMDDLVTVLEHHRTYEQGPTIKIVVITRDASGLRDRILRRSRSASLALQGTTEIHLKPIGNRADHERMFEQLCQYYAKNQVPMVSSIRHALPPKLESDPPIGLLHVASISALNKTEKYNNTVSFDQELYNVWTNEIASWENFRKDSGWPLSALSDIHIEMAVIWLSISPRYTREEAANKMRDITGLEGLSTLQAQNLVQWAANTYAVRDNQNSNFISIRPQIISDVAFLQMLKDNPVFARSCLSNLPETHSRLAISRFIGALPILPNAILALNLLIDSNFDRLVAAMDEAVTTAPRNATLDSHLAKSLKGSHILDVDIVSIMTTIPDGALPQTCSTLIDMRLQRAYANSGKDDIQTQRQIAEILAEMAIRLKDVGGQDQRAVGVSKKCVRILRRIAIYGNNADNAKLAHALCVHVHTLRGIYGVEHQAYGASEEAVRIYEGLANRNPGLYKSALADALIKYAGSTITSTVVWPESFTAAQTSIKLYRYLKKKYSGSYEKELAESLLVLSKLLYRAGRRHGKSYTAAKESVHILRRLASQNPIPYEPRLAAALSAEGLVLSQLNGRLDDALASIDESVRMFRNLSSENSSLYGIDLASSLIDYAEMLRNASARRYEALDFIDEALVITLRNFRKNSGRFDFLHASALHARCNILLTIGNRDEEALTFASKAVSAYNTMHSFAKNRHSFEGAAALCMQAQLLTALRPNNWGSDALSAINAAIVVHESHASGGLPDRQAVLVNTLLMKVNVLDALEQGGNKKESLKTVVEAIDICHKIFSVNPDAHRSILDRSLFKALDMLARATPSVTDAPIVLENINRGYERLEQQYPGEYLDHISHVRQARSWV